MESILDLEIVERYLELVLGREASVMQITVDVSPFLYAPVIEKTQVFGDDEWHNAALQTLPEHQQSAYATVAVLKWVYALKTDMKVENIVESGGLDGVISDE